MGGLKNQGIGAEMIADQWDVSREDLDAFSAESHRRAAQATAEGRFEREIVPVYVRDDEGRATDELMSTDEGIRPDSSVATLANLKPAFKEDGKVTAGNSSQITDGASAVLIMSEEKAKELGYTPRARFHSFALAGVDPVTMLTGPIPATKKVLERAGLTLDDIDLIEINEAFASVVLAWQKELDVDLSKVNVNGGAIALGHPLGASGAKLCATLVNELERTGGHVTGFSRCAKAADSRTRRSSSASANDSLLVARREIETDEHHDETADEVPRRHRTWQDSQIVQDDGQHAQTEQRDDKPPVPLRTVIVAHRTTSGDFAPSFWRDVTSNCLAITRFRCRLRHGAQCY